jgi:N-acetylmuramoyl-L-alanine amidase
MALSVALATQAVDVKAPRGSFSLQDQGHNGQAGFCAADLASALKGSLSRDEVSKYPVLMIEGHRILVSTASALASVDGKIVKLQVAPSQRDGCLWLPAEFLSLVLPRVLGGPVVVTGARAPDLPVATKSQPKANEADKGDSATIEASVAADSVRLTVQGRGSSRAEVAQSAREVSVSLPEAVFTGIVPAVGKGIVDALAVESGGRRLRVSLGPGFKGMESAKLRNPDRLVLLFKGEGQRLASQEPEPFPVPSEAPSPTGMAAESATGEPPKATTAFDTVVLDPGHGGPDTGAASAEGLLEKDLALSLAKKAAALLEKEGIRVILTRSSDQQVPLIQRTAIANYNRADLLLSVHLNASPVPSAKGTETYYMSRQATDSWSTQVAAKENSEGLDAAPPAEGGLNLVLWEMAQTSALVESAALAETIQQEFNALLGTNDRGVRQAPFAVLEGAQMPAVLVEVAFLSNPAEAKRLADPAFQDQIASTLVKSILNFKARYERPQTSPPAP